MPSSNARAHALPFNRDIYTAARPDVENTLYLSSPAKAKFSPEIIKRRQLVNMLRILLEQPNLGAWKEVIGQRIRQVEVTIEKIKNYFILSGARKLIDPTYTFDPPLKLFIDKFFAPALVELGAWKKLHAWLISARQCILNLKPADITFEKLSNEVTLISDALRIIESCWEDEATYARTGVPISWTRFVDDYRG